MPKWTDAQNDAINAKNCNILVSAAAGSGKTAVLVERVVKKLIDETNPVSIDKFLIVTFTNAAAADMKSKIANKLNELIAKNPNNTNAIRQLSLLPSAKISTIDSFCINLVRENFFKLDINQDFKIIDDSQRKIIEQNSMEEVLEEYYSDYSDNFKNLLSLFSSGNSDYKLIEAIKIISNYIVSQDFPYDWLDEVCEFYNPDIKFEDSYVTEYYLAEVLSLASESLKMIDDCKKDLSVDDPIYDKFMTMLESDYANFTKIVELSENKVWSDLKDFVYGTKFATKPRKSKEISLSESFITKSRTIYKDKIFKNIKGLLTISSEEYYDDCNYLYPIVKLLCEIVMKFDQKVMEYKREINSFTFGDIEHFAIDLLFYKKDSEICRTDLANELANEFEEILVDEYQDTNSAQDKLFEMLSNGRNRFMVGDVKQSIYRFRLAMPFIFNEKKDAYSRYSSENNDQSQKIILSNNFRSRKGVCEYTNFIFSHIMSKKIGELDYNNDEKLNFSAQYDETNVPSAGLCIVQTPEEEDIDEYEAHQVAKYILKKIESKELIKDKDTYRPIDFNDFAILLRSAKARVPVFNKVFSQYGIPTICENRTNLFSNAEVTILVNLLRVVDNPTLDVPLLATLMSLFYGYSADQIAKAKVEYKDKNLYSSIRKSDDFSRFVEDLSKYRTYASSMSVENFLRTIISETSFLSVISAMGNHEQRMLNVMKLVDIAKKFDNGENVGLTAFMRYVDAIIENGYDVGSASVNHSGENAVNIMTVHHSKGLEFPVVIYAGTCHKYNTQDQKQIYQMHPQVGIGIKSFNNDNMYRFNSVQYSVISELNKYASMSENLRVLYVAMTRAKEQFISFYSTKNVEKSLKTLSKKIIRNSIVNSEVKSISSDGDMILACALMHKDGNVLRNYLDDEIDVDNSALFDLNVEFLNEYMQEEIVTEKVTSSVDYELLEKIKSKLDFRYDNLSISNFASKRTASSLDEKEQDFKYLTSSKPAFLTKGNMTSAQKGTAMHAFMQYCIYENARSNLDSEIKRLVDNSYITEEQAESLDKKKITALFESDFAKRMFSSDNLYREIKVSTFVPVNMLEDTDCTDNVLVQGIADCVFEENGELVLVDYKTDKVDSEEELLSRYKNQLAFYKLAISKVLNKPVKESILYSFSLNKVCIYK